MGDWIKKDDPLFNTQALAMNTFIGNPLKRVLLSISSPDADDFNTRWTAWNTAFPAHAAHQAAAIPLTAAKDTSRAGMEAGMRAMAKIFRARHALGHVTDAHLLEAGIPLLDTTSTPATTPDTVPVVTIDASQRQRHEFHWRDDATPGKTARPANARTCEIRSIALADGTMPPADPTTWPYHAQDPKTPHLIIHEIEDLGKEGWVAARWIGHNGEPGPWSTVVHATILR